MGLLNEALAISDQDFATYQARLGLPPWFKGYMEYFQELLVTKSWALDNIKPLKSVYTDRFPMDYVPDSGREAALAGLSTDPKLSQVPVMVTKVFHLVFSDRRR